ncbi:MAG TPA: MFS transporter [Candidatus Binataceae bacterium]|nr:MFS transporter [Candidatus Binataceae bacterium]
MTKQESRGWWIVGTLFVSWFLVWGAGPSTTSVFFPAVLKTFGWSRAKLSAGFSVGALSAGIAAPIVGWLLDRVDARKVMTAGVAITVLAYVALSRIQSFGELVALNLALGVGLCACTGIPSSLVLANWFRERRGLAMGLALSGASIGGAIMVVVISYVIGAQGWRFGAIVVALPMLIVVIPLLLTFVRTRPDERATQVIEREAPALTGFEVRQAFSTRSLWLVTLLQFLGSSVWAGIGQHFVAYLIGIGYTPVFSAHMLSIVFLITTVGNLLSGPAADRLGARRALAVTWILGAISMLALVYATHLGALAVHVVLSGMVIGATGVLTPLIVLESMGLKNYGALMGISALFGTLGFAAGPIITGRIFDVTHSYTLALWLFVIACTICVVAALACVPYERAQERLATTTAAA